MSATKTDHFRRRILLAPLLGSIVGVLGLMSQGARAQEKASLIAKSVDKVPDSVDDTKWQETDALTLPLAPQAVVKPRLYEAGVKAISVRAYYDTETVAFLLEWADARKDSEMSGVEAFRDAVAIEFPADPSNGIPYFGMGEPNKPVTIYQWKADWQFGREHDVEGSYPGMVADWYPFSGRPAGEIASLTDYGRINRDKAFHTSWAAGNPLGDPELQTRTSVEKLRAEGFGTITSVGTEAHDATGHGVWKDDVWRVLIAVPRTQEAFAFSPGLTVPVAFAVWDGAKRERGGEKAISTWYFMSLEQPVGTAVYWGPLAAVVGVAAAQAWGLRHLHRKTAETSVATRVDGDV